ncbi:uncharacterized protein Mb2253c-like [Telopea speciosissima]|uniref:uncharacterized protein Mb2253c-like n=1 Tax=Telopea speciosissima TaxID=54955 RepID=UPI001CC54C19|nr:uncharacterized protein Mb2253c-like [Telopea speciosissima]
MFMDGASNAEVRGAGFILTSLEGFKIQFALHFNFLASNNEAEYEALIAGLRMAKAIQIKRLTVLVDSQLVVNQVKGHYEDKDDRMVVYLEIVKRLVNSFDVFEVSRVSQNENEKVDTFSRLSIEALAQLDGSVYIEQLSEPSHQV